MQPTEYSQVNTLLADLQHEIQQVLGRKLIGFYLYGSLVWGDFDPELSDIDMLAALTDDLTDSEASALETMHAKFALRYPAWNDRIEVQYFAQRGLQTFRTETHRMGNISPGEPFHIIDADRNWLFNWYFVQAYGVTLYGPPPQTLIPPIALSEFLQSVREHVEWWQTHVDVTHERAGFRAYAVLTMCRAIYSLTHGKQVSKRAAAEWATEHLPDWSALINEAWITRSNNERDLPAYAETKRFVLFTGQYIQTLSAPEIQD